MDVLATGYPSLDYILPVSHTPGVGETASLKALPDDLSATYGGCGLNIAVALTRLGFHTGVALVLGDDRAGMQYQRRLHDFQINTSDVSVLTEASTSRSYLFRAPNGEYQNFFYGGAADQWDGKLHLRNLPHVRYALVTVGQYNYNRQFVEKVCAANVPLVWALKPDIFAYPVEAMRSFAAASALILMNHIEANFVCKTLGLSNVRELLDSTTQTLVVTRGAAGCVVYTADADLPVPAVPDVAVVDTTGAGDAFAAGFLAGLLRAYDLQVCAQIGGVLASFVLEKVGCQTNLPNWEQMEARYTAHFGALP
ncbi:MAG: hypothetical protein IT324_19960 [Anaerolineae bacterium]|nr:hypothetical protein [Anaerolineae bacterium]